MQPEQRQLIDRWIAKAEEDYRNAAFVLTLKDDCPLSTVCFHSQQCVEKYLKSLLLAHSLSVPRSHDLLELCNRIPPEGRPEVPRSGLAVLNRYAVEARCPGDWDVITRPEAREALEVARTVREIVRQKLSGWTNQDESA